MKEEIRNDIFYVCSRPNKFTHIVWAEHMIELLRAVRDEMWKAQGNTRDFACEIYFWVRPDGFLYERYKVDIFIKTGESSEQFVLVNCNMKYAGEDRSMASWVKCGISAGINRDWKDDIQEIVNNHETGNMKDAHHELLDFQKKAKTKDDIITRLRGMIGGFVKAGECMDFLDDYLLEVSVVFGYDGSILREDYRLYWHASNTKDDDFNKSKTTKMFNLKSSKTDNVQAFIEKAINKEIAEPSLFD